MNDSIAPSSIIAILPAAGIGSRMQSVRPKQYLTINNKTVIEYSLASLLSHPAIQKVVVGLHPKDRWFKQLSISDNPKIITVIGGDSRAQTVLAGLEQAHQYSWVLVHDAVRPCLSWQDLDRLIKAGLLSNKGAILATPVRDTIKQTLPAELTISGTIDRQYLWHALTPQIFPVELLKNCLLHGLNNGVSITDEASALEYCGVHPTVVSGSLANIKITYPEDLRLAAFYLTR